MDRVQNFSESKLSQKEKDEIGLLVSKKILDPTFWTVVGFPDEALLRVCKLALIEQQDPKKVSFESLDVPVIHWQHLVAKKIRMSESCTFVDFRRRVRHSLSEEITTKIFRVYKLPYKFTSIEEKVLVDSEADFQAFMEQFNNPDEFPPELYIWNYEDESPKKLPGAKKERDCSTVVSRDSNQSKICKEKDGYICLCCGFFGPEGLTMKCCHLYEIKAHEALTTLAERKDKLKLLKLVDINELRNLVTMCEKCQTSFDNHQIGIHPIDRRWIIIESLRAMNAPSVSQYRDIHGRAVVFTSDTYEPPLEVLKDRFLHFLEKNKHKNAEKTIHYCHFCPESFSGVSGLADMCGHVELCRVTTFTREMNV